MFCEEYGEKYVFIGGRRGQGQIFFLHSMLAKTRAQLETARAKIKDLEQQLLNKDIRIARLTKGEKPEVIYMAAPAVPGPEIADPNIMELCFHNGEQHMKERILTKLKDISAEILFEERISGEMKVATFEQVIQILEDL